MDINLKREELYKKHPDYVNLVVLEKVTEQLRKYGSINQLDIYRELLNVVSNLKIRIDKDVDEQILKRLENESNN